MTHFIPICSRKTDGRLYAYLGNNEFQNIVNQVKKIVPEDEAAKIFFFEPELSELCNENENVLELIKLGFRQTK